MNVASSERGDWVRTPIDAFIAARHIERGLAPSPRADRRTLIRRLYFDLIGLPPEPAAVERFVNDDDPQGYEKLVDALLASPRYGERWARHWLDVVHYGDTHGYDKDKLRRHAWPYRDYVIRAFNEDKPYDRFVKEQLAGDVFYPGTPDGIVALGFIAAGPFDFVGHIEVAGGTVEKDRVRNIDRDDMVRTTMETFISLTVGCARCHDHKFDPIRSEDYYALQAVFAAVDRADRPYDPGPSLTRQGTTEEEVESTEQQEFLVYAAATDFPPQGNFLPTGGTPRPIHVLGRGDVQSPGEPIGPGTIAAIPWLSSRFSLDEDDGEGARRAALAEWIVHHDNPLTWRSIVNRVWYHHFGRGIVDTPNDFGRMGGTPTHPELLDWLAVWFRDNGRSLKKLHKLIATSAVYQQTSTNDPQLAAIDADNRYLWRMNGRRLEAEAIRDSILAVSGRLDTKMGGPGFFAFGFQDDHSPHYEYDKYDPDDPATWRRSVYRLIVRSVPDPLMTTLDCADPSLITPKRNETLTPLQALALMNNPFVVRMAEHFAARVREVAADTPSQVGAAYRLALARDPTDDERRTLVTIANEHGLANACRLIFNLNEFVFLD